MINTKMKIRIKYLRNIEHISRISNGDWIDLACAERVVMLPGDYRVIPLGVAMELPEGYEAVIVPRSSTFSKYGILQANGMGVIDETYNGDKDEWCFPAFATRRTVINKGDRICQFRLFAHQPDFDIETVDTLGNPDRGGFGSTGV